MSAIPCHVAFIMDGNGRWAVKRGLSRLKGHREGIKKGGACHRLLSETRHKSSQSFRVFNRKLEKSRARSGGAVQAGVPLS